MKISNAFIKKFIFLSIFAFTYGCSNNTKNVSTNYKLEAEELCNVFNPENWDDETIGMEPMDVQNLLSQKIYEAVQSEEMVSLINSLPSLPVNKRYEYYINSVTNLTGQKIECSDLNNYFSF
ncbi:MAG: hypothetical protein ACRBCS_12585 [Cellvibrionaceae bacterium]